MPQSPKCDAHGIGPLRVGHGLQSKAVRGESCIGRPHGNWRTPPSLYDQLDREFDFQFDPCPLNHDQSKWDGLTVPWKKRNFVNPPYDRHAKEAFICKAYAESKRGKISVLLLPVSTSSAIFHDLILPHAQIRFVRGRVRFAGVNSFGKIVGHDGAPRHNSMVVVFGLSHQRGLGARVDARPIEP